MDEIKSDDEIGPKKVICQITTFLMEKGKARG